MSNIRAAVLSWLQHPVIRLEYVEVDTVKALEADNVQLRREQVLLESKYHQALERVMQLEDKLREIERGCNDGSVVSGERDRAPSVYVQK